MANIIKLKAELEKTTGLLEEAVRAIEALEPLIQRVEPAYTLWPIASMAKNQIAANKALTEGRGS